MMPEVIVAVVKGSRPFGGEWVAPVLYVLAGVPIAYLNAIVVVVPVWAIWGRSGLTLSHWPLTLGASLSGAVTLTVLMHRSVGALAVPFGAVIGFLTALLFWTLSFRNP